MGLFGGGNSSSSSTTQNTTNNFDQRQVDTANGAGAFVAQSGSVFNINALDNGALAVAGSAVDNSIGLAKQIASTLGASVGQFSVGAAGSIDGLGHILDKQQTAVTGQANSTTFITIASLALVGLVAWAALRKGR